MPLSAGEIVLDRYVIEKMVGLGGMGEVYRARHQKLGMPVAVKTIVGNANPELIRRFAREAQLLARVRHPNVVQILDVGQTQDGSECMVMEFLEGEALDARLERRGALPWPEVRSIGLGVLKGLGSIHAAGIVHRDLKPANVLMAAGDPEIVKLVDFGIATPTSADAQKFTQAGAMIGTPAYMPPEQLVGAEVDARTDLYALALMLYELATGQLPFGDDPNAALRRMKDPIPPPVAPRGMPAISTGGSAAVMRALCPEKDGRPADTKSFYNALRGARRKGPDGKRRKSSTAVQAVRPPPPPPPAPPPPGTQAAQPPATAAYAGGHMAPTQVGQPQGPVRSLIAARLPVARMSRPEQQALAKLASPGRAYHLGGGNWFAVIPAASEDGAANAARRLGDALEDRYEDACEIVWAPASSSFALTPASLSGAAPLPDEISRLFEHLQKVEDDED